MQGLRQIGETISELDLDAMMGLMDVDGDGSIDYREFVKVGQMKDELAEMQEVRTPPLALLQFRKVLPGAREARREQNGCDENNQLSLILTQTSGVTFVSVLVGGAAEQRGAIGAAGLARPGEVRGADREPGAAVGGEVEERHGAGARQLAARSSARLGLCCRCLVQSAVMGMC